MYFIFYLDICSPEKGCFWEEWSHVITPSNGQSYCKEKVNINTPWLCHIYVIFIIADLSLQWSVNLWPALHLVSTLTRPKSWRRWQVLLCLVCIHRDSEVLWSYCNLDTTSFTLRPWNSFVQLEIPSWWVELALCGALMSFLRTMWSEIRECWPVQHSGSFPILHPCNLCFWTGFSRRETCYGRFRSLVRPCCVSLWPWRTTTWRRSSTTTTSMPPTSHNLATFSSTRLLFGRWST